MNTYQHQAIQYTSDRIDETIQRRHELMIALLANGQAAALAGHVSTVARDLDLHSVTNVLIDRAGLNAEEPDV